MKFWFALIIKNHVSRVSIGILWAWLTMISGVALLMLSGWFITATAIAGAAIAAAIVITFDMYVPGSGIRFFALSRTISRYTERIYNHDTILRLIALFRVTLFSQIANMPLSELRQNTDSEWLGKLTADIDALDSILIRYIIPPVAALALILTVSILLSTIWFEFALYSALFMLFTLTITIQCTIRSTSSSGKRVNSLLNQLRVQVIEHLNGVLELHSFNVMHRHQHSINNSIELLMLAQTKLNTKTMQLQSWLDWLLQLNLLIVVIWVLSAFAAAVISGPQAIMLVMMYLGINEILQSVVSQFSTWGKTQFAAHRLDTLKYSPRVDEENSTTLDTITKIDVQLKGEQLIKSHEKDIFFTLNSGEILNVIGQSGTGKSSLADLLSGVTPLNNSSHYIVNGTLSTSPQIPENWYQKVSYLEQSNTILAGSLGYNLCLGLPEIAEEKVWSVLTQLELTQWVNGLPEGLNTWLGESGCQLSGGQARRVCLARLLLREPDLVVLDEPFNGIDAMMAARIWHQICPWLSSRIVVVFTHEKPDYIDASTTEIFELKNT